MLPARKEQTRVAISLAFGVMFMLLGLLIPVITPDNQRNEILMLTFWFCLTGALLLHASKTYQRADNARLSWRSAAGVVLSLVGIGLPLMRVPFVRDIAAADERFYVMIAIAPAFIAGLLMLRAVWTREPAPDELPTQPSRTPVKREKVARVPKDDLYRKVIPVALALLFIAITAVVAAVVLPALLPLFR